MNENILSERYVTEEINNIFSEVEKIKLERKFWICVMKKQKELGVDISDEDISKYETAVDNINLDRIKEIEKVTRHDVKARLEAFVEVSGANEVVHLGMTSRDLTDNVEQIQILNASKIIRGKYVAVMKKLLDKAKEYEAIVLTARTHHQAAQPTLLGRRFSMWAEELRLHIEDFDNFISSLSLKGIKGPVGTQFDMVNVIGDYEKVVELERAVAEEFGFNLEKVLSSVGQVYPRSLDYSLISKLSLLAAGCENFAVGMRLMAGSELVTEGFREGQVGSSAMPHKMNTRSSERICGFAKLIKMYASGASSLAGDQWEEGDVSCSVVRRVIIQDAFYVSDGICETMIDILNKMGVYEKVIAAEVDRYLPFLASTEILMIAVKNGIGREEAHEVIKKYSVNAALSLKDNPESENNFITELAKDELFVSKGITLEMLNGVLENKIHFVGCAKEQIQKVIDDSSDLINRFKDESEYNGKEVI